MYSRSLWPAMLLLTLSGCYVAPPEADYGSVPSSDPPGVYPPGAYPPGAYPPGAYPSANGYAPAPYDPNGSAYPSYDYSDGPPVIIENGAPVPLVLLGGEWGFYDQGHRWRRAPEGAYHDWQQRHAGNAPFHQGGPPPDGHQGQPWPQNHPEHERGPYHGQNPYRPPEQARPASAPGPIPPPASARPAPPPQEHQGRHSCPPRQMC